MKVTILGPEFLGDPEVTCMLQAFASRSKMPIAERLAALGGDFEAIKVKLKQYYVGYGHESVGQCADITLFLEDVSILAAKAIQHNQLYTGIESSTRYIDFVNEPLVNPGLLPDSVQQEWISLYSDVSRDVEQALRARYVNEDGSSPQMAKSCKLKAFDIARAFLPAGVTTNLSWTTSISTLNRELVRLSRHVLAEVREIAVTINKLVKDHLPNVWQALPATDDCFAFAGLNYDPYPSELQSVRAIKLYNVNLTGRVSPEKYARLDHDVHASYFVSVISSIDYGSFRDIQRHRTLNPSSPVLQLGSASSIPRPYGTYGFNFHRWYLDALRELGVLPSIETRLHTLLTNLAIEYARLPGKACYDFQYYLPLGLEVPVILQGYLGDWLYVLQLRSTPSVHPTVRQLCASTWSQLQPNLDQSLCDYLNVNVGDIPMEDPLMLRPHIARAGQDIIKKP